jgi:peptide/nickel transport system permease protein
MTKPDGEKITIYQGGASAQQNIRFSQEQKLIKRYPTETPMQGLFSDPKQKTLTPLKGNYQITVTGTTFEKDSDINVQFVFFGTVYGLAGTDMNRRDLTISLMWGTPIALAFGLIGSLGTLILTMIIAAIGAWYGGWVDGLIQRITEINLVLPFLPILIMVGTFFSRSIWVILGTAILLSIFTGQIKSYRAIFMQIRESGYIEAAKAYGASDFRIIFRYLIPRMIPLLIPGLISSVPSFVFLEATLAVLGLGDPVLPTWGKMINDADVHAALFKGYYYWMVEPAVLLMVTGLGFAMLGFALDRVFNPKLREM